MRTFFLNTRIVVFGALLFVLSLTGCTREITAPEPIYDQITLLPMVQPVMNMKIGEERSNSVMLCLPRGVNVVNVDVTRSSSVVDFRGGYWGTMGGSCEGSRDLFTASVILFGQEIGKTKVTLTFSFTRGNPKMVSFDAVVTAAPVLPKG